MGADGESPVLCALGAPGEQVMEAWAGGLPWLPGLRSGLPSPPAPLLTPEGLLSGVGSELLLLPPRLGFKIQCFVGSHQMILSLTKWSGNFLAYSLP